MNDKSKELLIQASIGLLVLFVVYKLATKLFSTGSGGLFGAGAESNEATLTLADKEAKKLESAGIKASKSNAEWQSIANTIFENGKIKNPATFGADNDFKGIVYQMSRVQNEVDVYKLIQYFGTHNRFAFGVPVTQEMDLFNFVRNCLDDSYIATINSNWSRKGIKIRL
jgi:hypothetical protein